MSNGKGTVLVTGGSRGIGAEAVSLIAQEGYDVCFTYLDQAEAAQAVVDRVRASGGRAWSMRADVGDEATARQLVDRLPAEAQPVVALVNNVGITGPIRPFVDTDPATMRRVIEVNVLGTMILTQQLVRRWIADRVAGSVVNVSSTAATLGSANEFIHYAASKAAVDAFTIGLAKELAPQGIRVNAVAPGTTLTDIHAAAGEPDRPARVAPRIPMGRAGRPQEIAEAIAWLVSTKASYVTGAILRVSGGL